MYVYISHSNYRLPNSSSSRLYIGQDMVALPEEKNKSAHPGSLQVSQIGQRRWPATMVHVY